MARQHQLNYHDLLFSYLKPIWTPPEKLPVDEWVEKNVWLPVFTAAEPGPLRIDRTPYTRGVLKSLGSQFIEWVVLVWGRQLGKSQGIQYPYLCYCIDQDPGPAICLLPTLDKVKYTSKRRIQPMFDSCEAVAKKKSPNPDDFTITEMQFTDMILSMAWGGSGSQLTTRPSRYLFRDEVDELKKSVGENAIDPMTAIEQTTSNFSNRKIIDTSTPTTPGGNIWKELKKCAYIFELWMPCPLCNQPQILYWENVRFGDDPDPQVVENIAYYECEHCHGQISNLDKIRMLVQSEWRARVSIDPSGQIMKDKRALITDTVALDDVLQNHHIKKIGFHLPKWYSPFSGGTFGIIAKEFLEAQKSYDEGDDFAPLRNWKIYNAARPWEEVAISETEIELMGNKVDLPQMVCPKNTIAITAGVDPGQGGFWYAVFAWRRDYSAHLIQYGFMAGNYETSGIEALLREWTFAIDGLDRRLGIWRIGIDTGGGKYSDSDSTMTEDAYLWIRRMRDRRLFGTKGVTTDRIRRVREVRLDKMPGDKGAIIPGGLLLLEINSDAMKDVIWFHLRIKPKELVNEETGEIVIDQMPSGRFTFHADTATDFPQHILAEEKKMDKDGAWEWIRVKRTNHLLDCTVIAFAMADSEFRGGIRVLPNLSQPQKEKEEGQPPKSMPPRRGGNWIKRW